MDVLLLIDICTVALVTMAPIVFNNPYCLPHLQSYDVHKQTADPTAYWVNVNMESLRVETQRWGGGGGGGTED